MRKPGSNFKKLIKMTKEKKLDADLTWKAASSFCCHKIDVKKRKSIDIFIFIINYFYQKLLSLF